MQLNDFIKKIVNDISIKTTKSKIGQMEISITYHTFLSKVNDFYKYYYFRIEERNATSLDKLFVGVFTRVASFDDTLANKIAHGVILLSIDDIAYEIDLKQEIARSPSESVIDSVSMYNARDGFIENIKANLSLIEKRINSKNLTINNYILGKTIPTNVNVIYDKTKIKKADLKLIDKLLNTFSKEAITSVNDVASLFNDNKIFPMVSFTGYPSLATDYIVQGRYIILIDNFPIAIVLPVTLDYFTIERESNSSPPYISIYHRILCFISFFFSVFALGTYVAAMNYHPQNLSVLIISEVKITTRGTTIPLYMEIFLMLTIFELVRLASSKAPSPHILNIIIIIGGIIIGQNAVNSGFIGAFNIVITALSFLSTYAVTNNQYLIISITIMRFLVLLCGTLFGFFGIIIISIIILVYLYNLKSLNTKYLSPWIPTNYKEILATFVQKSFLEKRKKK